LREALIGIRTLVKKGGVLIGRVGGSVAPWLVQSSLDQEVWFEALAGNVLFLGKTLFSEVPLSPQVYAWGIGQLNVGLTLRWTSIQSRGV